MLTGYLEKDYTPVFGTLTKPALYNLTAKGRKYIRETYQNLDRKYLARLQDDKRRSKAYRIRCQIIADLYLIIFPNEIHAFVKNLEVIRTQQITLVYNEFQFFTQAFYHQLDFILLPRLKPDAYVYRRTKEGITHTIIYVIDAYIPKLMLGYLLKKIFNALDEEYWEDEHVASCIS